MSLSYRRSQIIVTCCAGQFVPLNVPMGRFLECEMNLQARESSSFVQQAHCVLGLDYKKHMMVSTLSITRPGILVFPYRIFNYLCLSSCGETPGGWSLDVDLHQEHLLLTTALAGEDMARAGHALCRLMFCTSGTLAFFSGDGHGRSGGRLLPAALARHQRP
jgi:hypothetical protein